MMVSSTMILHFVAALGILAYLEATTRPLRITERSFYIDYSNDTFVKDGRPYRFISGTMHFARTPHYYWPDRLQKLRAAGFTAVQTYVFWNYHEPRPGIYDFTGQRDIISFLKISQSFGLDVILRVGPYICAEWDFGGLPAWLLKDSPHVIVRSMDPVYIKAVDRWLDVILRKIAPMLYKNGGPIISVQVENEYGNYFACDHDYMRYLRQKFVSVLGRDVVLFTSDSNKKRHFRCGTLEGLFTTVNFHITNDAKEAFELLRTFQPHGPLVNSEFYIGWQDYWLVNHTHISPSSAATGLDLLLAYGANVNNYVFAGGSNFEFNNGARDKPFQPVTTSYDFDGILSEAGDITEKYHRIRKVISKYKILPKIPIPPSTPKFAYGNITMKYVDNLYNLLDHLCKKPVFSTLPKTMERLEQYFGFVLYRHKTTKGYRNAKLMIKGLRDRAYVAINQMPHGVLHRDRLTHSMISSRSGDVIDLLVENQGRINHGLHLMNNSKGIVGNVTLGGDTLLGWTMYPLSFDDMSFLSNIPHKRPLIHVVKRQLGEIYTLPSFFIGQFSMPRNSHPMDTYLDPRPFTKGQAFLNTHNVGRYWPAAGPQVTLYVPKGMLSRSNIVILFELEHSPLTKYANISFIDHAYINKTVYI